MSPPPPVNRNLYYFPVMEGIVIIIIIILGGPICDKCISAGSRLCSVDLSHRQPYQILGTVLSPPPHPFPPPHIFLYLSFCYVCGKVNLLYIVLYFSIKKLRVQ